MKQLIKSVVLLSLLAVRCASTHAPKGWLPPVTESGSDGFGGWVEVWTFRPEVKSDGEFIAVNTEHLLILTTSGLREIPLADITRARVTAYQPETRRVNTWIVGGALSTATHGVWLLATLPAWLLTGAFAMDEVLRQAEMRYPETPWSEFSKYARFPQGFPQGTDARLLRPKLRQPPAAVSED